MKILLSNVNPSWGGGELWFFQAARDLAARGHDVRTLVRPGSKLAGRLADENLATVELGTDPFDDATPDVMLCNTRKKDLRNLWTYKRCPRRGVVLRKGILRPIANRLISRHQLRRLSHILTNSDATSAIVRKSVPWFPEDRITRLYNPVFMDPLPTVTGDGALRILSVGRLVDAKGFDVLLDAVARLQRPWSLTVAGTGRNADALAAQTKKLGIESRVTLAGHIDDVRPLYAAADVVAISSRYEGFCFVAAEAALAGLPIVSTTAGSLPEVARGAAFVPADDAAAFASALEAVEPGFREAAQSEARALFDPKQTFDALERFLELAATQDEVGRSGS